MSFLSFLSVGIPAQGRLVYRPVYPQVVTSDTGGVGGVRGHGKKRKIVRRADFSSQENFELALKASLADATLAYAAEPVADTQIKVSAEALVALQAAPDMDEAELVQMFIYAIESEDC